MNVFRFLKALIYLNADGYIREFRNLNANRNVFGFLKTLIYLIDDGYLRYLNANMECVEIPLKT